MPPGKSKDMNGHSALVAPSHSIPTTSRTPGTAIPPSTGRSRRRIFAHRSTVMDAGMADESIEALELAWQDLFRRIPTAGHEQGEGAAFDLFLRQIHEVAGPAASGHAVAGGNGPPP